MPNTYFLSTIPVLYQIFVRVWKMHKLVVVAQLDLRNTCVSVYIPQDTKVSL